MLNATQIPQLNITETVKFLHKFKLQITTLGCKKVLQHSFLSLNDTQVFNGRLCAVTKRLLGPAPSETHFLFIVF